ncbi:MAG: class I SAM-dependent methyltransferase [Phycisphaeraceae bacterium]|nr:class I SAM-dependent methyltransferase [Phycisphaeraceae bacterium]
MSEPTISAPTANNDPTPTTGLWQVTRPGEGLVLVRHVNAPDPQPTDWLKILGSFIKRLPRIKLVGAKRYFADGHVFSLGENMIHPKGFHHHGKGVGSNCYRFPEEVDAIASGVMVVEEKAFDAAHGEKLLNALPQLGPMALGLTIRLQGGRCMAVPQVIVTDEFSPSPADAETTAFQEIFGFDWASPDMRDVYARHEGSGLLWNVALHAGMMPFEKYDQRGALVWEGYKKADPLKQRCDHLAQLVSEYALGKDGPVLDVGCGDGLFSHLFAMKDLQVIGIDPEPQGVAVSTKMCSTQTYPANTKGGPKFQLGRGDAIPFGDNFAACITLFDVIEHLANPIQILKEITRTLKPGGHLICVTPSWQFGGSSDAVYHGFEYTSEELNRQINATPKLQIVRNGNITGIYRDLIAIAQKSE